MCLCSYLPRDIVCFFTSNQLKNALGDKYPCPLCHWWEQTGSSRSSSGLKLANWSCLVCHLMFTTAAGFTPGTGAKPGLAVNSYLPQSNSFIQTSFLQMLWTLGQLHNTGFYVKEIAESSLSFDAFYWPCQPLHIDACVKAENGKYLQFLLSHWVRLARYVLEWLHTWFLCSCIWQLLWSGISLKSSPDHPI